MQLHRVLAATASGKETFFENHSSYYLTLQIGYLDDKTNSMQLMEIWGFAALEDKFYNLKFAV